MNGDNAQSGGDHNGDLRSCVGSLQSLHSIAEIL